MSMFTMGSLARTAGVNAETIRYYERRGLLPEPPRTSSGYRQYSDDDLRRLELIRRAKELGFTLTEISDLLMGTCPGHGVQATQAGHGVQATQAGHGVQATQAGHGVQATQAGQAGQAGSQDVREAVRRKLVQLDGELQRIATQQCRLRQLLQLCEGGDDAGCETLGWGGAPSERK